MSNVKFGRNYKLTIQVADDEAIVIEYPATIQFTVHRSISASLNSINLQIYNLSEEKRNRIYQDRYQPTRRKLILEAGYDNLSTIFIGDIFEANSARQGTNLITSIDARDGYFDTNQTMVNTTIIKGKTQKELIEFLAAQFPNLKIGKIGNFEGTLERAVVLEGNVYEQLKKYSGGNQFIDLEVINVIGENEFIINPDLPLLDASTGMLDTPRRDNAFLTVTTLFEPRVIMGQNVNVKSDVNPAYNGVYKVLGVTHQGVISGAVNGRLVSIFNLNNNKLVKGFEAV